MKKKNFRIKGQSLIEAVIALGVVLLVVIALVQAVTTSIKSADFAKKTAQAASYCQEGMENIRAYRDASWTTFLTKVGSKRDLSTPTPGVACPSNPNISGTPFIRCVEMGQIAADKVKATVTVDWSDSSGTHTSKLISFFTKWQ